MKPYKHDWVDGWYITEYLHDDANTVDASFKGKLSYMAATYAVVASLHRVEDDIPVVLYVPGFGMLVVDTYKPDEEFSEEQMYMDQFMAIRTPADHRVSDAVPRVLIPQESLDEWVSIFSSEG